MQKSECRLRNFKKEVEFKSPKGATQSSTGRRPVGERRTDDAAHYSDGVKPCVFETCPGDAGRCPALADGTLTGFLNKG